MIKDIAGGVGAGLGWGLGLGLALGITSAVGGGVRPIAKGAIKGGLWAKERMTGVMSEASERLQDVYHEARAERDGENGGGAGTSTSRAKRPEVVTPSDDEPSGGT